MRDVEECPNCGANYRRGRLACPECGSDAATGWKSADEIDYESIEIPDSWDEAAHASHRPRRLWLVAAAVALAAFATWAVTR